MTDKINLDNFDTVMALSKREGRYFIFPGEYLPSGEDFKVEIGDKPSVTLVSAYHNAVRKAYEWQESEAAESNRKGTPVSGPEERGVAYTANEEGVRPTVPAVEQTIEEVIQARLEAATIAVASTWSMLKEVEEAHASACAEETKLKQLLEALGNG